MDIGWTEMEPDLLDAVMKQLQSSLCLLAGEGRAALDALPDGCVKADELALDYNHWLEVAAANWGTRLRPEQRDALAQVDQLLDQMSGASNARLWTEEAVVSDNRWEQVRSAARRAVESMGWDCSANEPK
jgi:hypothetical protein